eukprot:TRINITY_DN8767_c0_g1_i2.p1 TRINITY_DN8767_c0_g1~~TRINITY_DN8767_c0_g1_i2.p1  ORF type:complete len:910 (+),score=159.55 TRINITY_DN8767_c0_g1_i2:60-2732(+)
MEVESQEAQDMDKLLAEVAKLHRRSLAKVAETYGQEIQQLRAESAASHSALVMEKGSVQPIPGIMREEGVKVTEKGDHIHLFSEPHLAQALHEGPAQQVPGFVEEDGKSNVPLHPLGIVPSPPRLEEAEKGDGIRVSWKSQSALVSEEGFDQHILGGVREEGRKIAERHRHDTYPRPPPLVAVEKGDQVRLSSKASLRSARTKLKEQDRSPSLRRQSYISVSSKDSPALSRRPSAWHDASSDVFASLQHSAFSALNEAASSQPKLLPLWIQAKEIGDQSPRTPHSVLTQRRTTKSFKMSEILEKATVDNRSIIMKRLNRFVAQPSAPKRVGYEAFGLFLIFFDMIWLPLQAFEPPASLLIDIQGWTSILYWSLDIPCSFFVGFVVPSQGIVETRLPKIAKNYVRSWFAFDILVVFVDWVLTVLSVSGDVEVFAEAGFMRMGKAIRLLKLLRLLRMVKAQKALADLTEKIQSESAVIIIGIVKQLFLILFFNHVLACSWFAIGSLDPQRQDTWVKEYELVGKSMLYQYFTSLHWSLTQFTPASMEVFPANDMERTFTVIVILLAMCIFSSFISTITNAVAQLRNINSGRHEQLSKLRRYFLENKVSVPLMACIWSCLHQSAASATKRRRVHEEDIAPVLQSLPAALRLELAEQVYASTLAFHPFFKHYGTYRAPQLNKICSQVHAMSLNVSAELFTVETPAENMFFLVDGSMAYRRQNQAGNDEAPENATSMNSISWAAEAVMWVNWKHAGSLTAMSDCELVRLHADTIQTTLVKGETDFRDVLRYARAFAKYVERYPDKASDLCEDPSLFRQLAWIAFERPENEAQQEASPRLSSRRSTEVDIDEATQELLQQAALRRKLEGEFFYDSSSSASGSSSSSEAFDSGPDSPR